MTKYKAAVDALHAWSHRMIDQKTTGARKRIRGVTLAYSEEVDSVLRETEDTAAKFGVALDNDEAMTRVLNLVLGGRGIDTAEPAPLFPEDGNNGTDGHVGGEASESGAGGTEADRAACPAAGESVGGVGSGPGENGTATSTGGKGKRRRSQQS